MQKGELVGELASRAGLSKAIVGRVLDALGDVILDAADAPGTLTLGKVGKLQFEHRAARTGRNPSTGEAVTISARRSVKLVPAKALKDALTAS